MSLGPEALYLADFGVTPEPFWAELTNVAAVGNSITKTGGGAGWNASGVVGRTILADGSVHFSSSETDKAKVAGLSSVNPDTGYTSIKFGCYLDLTPGWIPIESGVTKPPAFGYAPGDEFEIRVAAGVVTYWQRTLPGAWVLRYTSLATPSAPLFFDSSLFDVGATLNDVTLTGDLPNVASWSDLTANGHDVAQAIGLRQPLLDRAGGIAPRVIFPLPRQASLLGVAIPFPGAGNHSAVLVRRYRSLNVTPGNWMVPFHNGTVFVDGFALLQSPVPQDDHYHWGPGAAAAANMAPDLLLRSHILRWDGANSLSRVAGVDQPVLALGPYTAPTGPFNISGWDAAPDYSADMELSMLAIFRRSLSATDLAVCANLFGQHYGIP